MEPPLNYVGIDVASATFTSAVGRMGEKWQIVVRPAQFANEYDSFAKYLHWLRVHEVKADNSVICMEATGVYSEVLAHFLVANRYRVAIEPPLKVKRAFKPEGHKSDAVDSCQISEYAISELKAHIQRLEAEIQRLIDQDPDFRNTVALLISIPGVGMLLAAHMLLTIQSAPQPLSPKSLAAFIGICPYEDSSGSSIHHTATSRHYGPPGLRKLLFLAALSVRTHNAHFKTYFLRKLQEGKPKKLIINNIANKLLKIMVAVVRSSTPFIPNYRSVNPGLLKKALTTS